MWNGAVSKGMQTKPHIFTKAIVLLCEKLPLAENGEPQPLGAVSGNTCGRSEEQDVSKIQAILSPMLKKPSLHDDILTDLS
ncbi:hypothetical protein UY3_06009 [Chelonia mydas]|uniref:Uncharacterized protein n=1 Tax=Chelonia mydas TaxID=8469 RepID=M7BXL1_CHEMY|nr:hypothetical protein UY3_06009 [Chelonia mydas]